MQKRNHHTSIPIAYGRKIKEVYTNVKFLFEIFQDAKHEWNVYRDFKIIDFLQRMIQSEYMKHSCFLCFWNSRDDEARFCTVLKIDVKTLRSLPGVRF